jgi:hypothetical protein
MNARAETHRPDGEEEWLALRQRYIGASEIPVLFGHGYTTYYRLWHEKAGLLEAEDLSGSLPVVVGKCLESGMADVIRHMQGHELRKARRYLVHHDPSLRLGCSLDYELRTEQHGWVPAEFKIIDWQTFKDGFEELEEAGKYDPPLKYSLQLQQQMMITNKPIGYLFCLIGNRQLVEICHEAIPSVQEKIIAAARAFWSSVESGQAPPPDYDADLQLMYQTMTNVEEGREIHVHGDLWWEGALLAYAEAGKAEREAKATKDRLRAEVLDRMGSAIRAKMSSGTISAKLTDRYGTVRRELRITPKRGLLNE